MGSPVIEIGIGDCSDAKEETEDKALNHHAMEKERCVHGDDSEKTVGCWENHVLVQEWSDQQESYDQDCWIQKSESTCLIDTIANTKISYGSLPAHKDAGVAHGAQTRGDKVKYFLFC